MKPGSDFVGGDQAVEECSVFISAMNAILSRSRADR